MNHWFVVIPLYFIIKDIYSCSHLIQDRDESAGTDSSIKKRRGEDGEKHRSDKQNGSEEKRKSSSDRKRL